MKKQAPKIGDLKIADTQNGNDCYECVLAPGCEEVCDLPINKHYELWIKTYKSLFFIRQMQTYL